MAKRWVRRPEGSNWGEFGGDDQFGRLNLVTPEKVRQGLAEAREGLSFALSLPLNLPGGTALNPRRHPPALRPTIRDGKPNFNVTLDDPRATDVLNDDLVVLYLQYSTQWDSLAHVGALFDADGDGVAERVYYNGFRAGEDLIGPAGLDGTGVGRESTSAALRLGIENMAAHGVQGRGVMLDLRAHLGDARRLVGFDLIERVMAADGVAVEPGDILLIHTGFADVVLGMAGNPDGERLHNSCAVLDGRDQRLLDWITASGVAAIAADNYAVEAFPAASHNHDAAESILPLHEHCLFKNGIHLGELWHLTTLAGWLRDHGRNRFLLTAPPLRLPGAVGSPVTPVATV